MAERVVDVHVVIGEHELLAGRLWSHRRRNRESATFAYSPDYLSHPRAYELDPGLPMLAGHQQTPADRATFGAFSDCAPDRWGRRLINRGEERRARRDGDAGRSFGEIDYLLGVRDDLRQGGLRFRDPASGAYLAQERAGIPHLIDLGTLLSAADRLERDEATDEELDTLLRGGSSLGGARPKAHVLDQSGRIAIAKFPSPTADEWDVMRWESVALRLARDAGIRVPDSSLYEIDGKAVHVVDRFDRVDGMRVGYVSAMTMLEVTDRDPDGATYLDIAEVIETHSPHAEADLHELWRRMVFSVLIRNTDDHLRNHGFLRTTTAGWALSPAFDLNPDPRPGTKRLSTAIDHGSTEALIATVMDVAPYFRLTATRATAIVAEVSGATSVWRAAASDAGLDETAARRMSPAFEHDEAGAARAMEARA